MFEQRLEMTIDLSSTILLMNSVLVALSMLSLHKRSSFVLDFEHHSHDQPVWDRLKRSVQCKKIKNNGYRPEVCYLADSRFPWLWHLGRNDLHTCSLR